MFILYGPKTWKISKVLKVDSGRVICLAHFPFIMCELLPLQVHQSELDQDLVKTILSEYKIHNADVNLRGDYTSEDLIDVVEGNRVYIPAIYLLNKIDQISIEVGCLPWLFQYFMSQIIALV